MITLPKLRKINVNRNKKKILLISDDLRLTSGIATMSKELVVGTSNHFDWVQLAAALQHPDHGKRFDISEEIERETGFENVSVKLYAHTGYGNQDVIREVMSIEKPDALMIFTDPRFFDHVFTMEHEIRTKWKIPIIYWNIWDDGPYPYWNLPAYKSCDMLMNISQQTQQLVKGVLGENGSVDIDLNEAYQQGKPILTYLPHGINAKYFYPIDSDAEYEQLVRDFKEKNDVDFIVFWNNRNVRRKQPGDVILAYRTFCDKLTKAQASRCALFMHTAIADENGTDLMAVKNAVCPEYKVIFNVEMLPAKILNYFYNMADVTLNIASNEGFGLSNAESIMAGTPVIANVTGGLQDLMGFIDDENAELKFTVDFPSNHSGKYRKCGAWAFPVFPTNRSLQGSVQTPYIFDDRCSFSDVANRLFEVYQLKQTDNIALKNYGRLGSMWMRSNSKMFSSETMCRKAIENLNYLFANWIPPKKFNVERIDRKNKIKNPGIVF